ncbi:MAG: Ribonuclease VapC9 [Candidatus Methanofastidiosum methylothiophilum]|uniref:Ribonuclease VapC9 n=1 Tax=Candidatus Methanofastidiosum methylothiophilum TaxID=1705564 RepID=A0A150IS28_9EURY|nr:MAG: Ribonuclease VapC9 [Candidatus Methanofastidiosum methylthiophilus]KYC47787.1 MAG: Ribonuclease VapC9 [Candidatus Methanofastidiosum methylthiophilus]KYC49415.1 MAG: Ribonuclease VapC9 [Candidatus Methanofastidiosum methylthiophilus]
METNRLRNNKVIVILDTNFLLLPGRFNLRIESIEDVIEKKCLLLIPTNVISELNKIELTGSDRISKDIALKISERYEKIDLEGPVDRSILEYAKNNKCIVATNDMKLKSDLRKIQVPVVFLKKGVRLALEGYIE